jgi:hypothetical protein
MKRYPVIRYKEWPRQISTHESRHVSLAAGAVVDMAAKMA